MAPLEPSTGWPRLALGELWRHRELLGFFVWRDVKVRYKQTLLGLGWAIVQPLASLVVFSVVFGRLAHLASDGVPYPAFCLAGLLPWMLFAAGVTSAANSLVGNVNLLTKVYFPRFCYRYRTWFGRVTDFTVSLVLALVVLAWYGIAPSARLLLLPLPVALVLATAAARLVVGGANARYRDVRHALPFLVQMWMYGTPIVYSLASCRVYGSPARAVNPLVTAMRDSRILLGRAARRLIWLFPRRCAAILLLASGLALFRYTERSLADTI